MQAHWHAGILGCGCGGMQWGHVGVQTRLHADQCKEKRKTYLLMWVGMWMRGHAGTLECGCGWSWMRMSVKEEKNLLDHADGCVRVDT